MKFVGILNYLMVVSALLCTDANAQNGETPLKIGDQLPDHELQMANYVKPTVKLSSFRGKALIIDFWATWCGPCVGAFPHNNEIQAKYNEKLVILPVSYESMEIVQPFLKKMNTYNKSNNFSAVNDGQLKKWFPHSSIPRYVWVNSKGIVQGASFKINTEDATEFVKHDKITLRPVVEEHDGSNVRVGTDSSTPGWKGLGTYELGKMIELDSTVKSFKLFRQEFNPLSISQIRNTPNLAVFSNVSLRVLFDFAYNRNFTGNVVLITKDSSRWTDNYGKGKYDEQFRIDWIKNHGLNYILKIDDPTYSNRLDVLKSDLTAAYPEIKTSFEMHDKKFLMLKKIPGSKQLFPTKGGQRSERYDKYSITLRNVPLNALLFNILHVPYQEYQIMNDTGYEGNIDLNIETKIGDLAALNAELRPYGLVFIEETKPIKMLVVDDTSK